MNLENFGHYVPFVSLVMDNKNVPSQHAPLLTRVIEIGVGALITIAVLKANVEDIKDDVGVMRAEINHQIADIKTDIREIQRRQYEEQKDAKHR